MKRTKKYVLIFTVLPVLFSFSSCEKDVEQQKTNEAPFVEIVYRSNADTLFLFWELINTTPNFDHFQIEVGKSKEKIQTLGKDKGECFFTHVPYKVPVPVSVSLVENDRVIGTNSIGVSIDGVDKTIAWVIMPERGGVALGDGMFSTLLPDGRSFFSMQDSFVGDIINGKFTSRPGSGMYRNTYFVYDPASGTVTRIYGANDDPNSSAAIPLCCPTQDKWYWPGNGFVIGDKLYKFCSLLYMASEGDWGMAVERVNVLTYQLPGLEFISETPVPYNGADRVYETALVDGEYVYIYATVGIEGGLEPKVDVMAARAASSNPYTDWQYYTGSGWSDNASDAVRLEGLADVPVSSLSVFKLRDKYVLLTQRQELWRGEIHTFTSDTPYGPWTNKQTVFTAQEPDNLYTYNATAHPQIQKDGMILVSYNVNQNGTFEGLEGFVILFNNPGFYRPRFFWVDIDNILN